MIGRTLGNYRIIEQIGMGGMATVFKAYDPDTDRYVAIKVLPEHFSQDPTFRQRFEREAKAIAKLEHLHILPLFAYGEDDSTAYMVMRYFKAGSLTERIREGALSFDEASRLLGQIASALDHAHTHGVLHRDVKPSNVLLDADGNAYLTDFGIAKMVESAVDLTGGGILGTPAYMSPEQCRGNTELTPASDQYSLGIILYEMVTGRAPFQAETPIALIHMQLSEPLPLPRQIRPDLPEDAERVILKALTKEPNLRFENCNTMAAAFARAVADAPTAVPAPMEDLTLATEKPIAVTAPVVEEATVLHGAAPAAAKKQRRLPWWAWVLVALLVVGLGGLVLGFILSGADDEPAVAGQDDEVEIEFDDEWGGLPEDYREVRPCDWAGHGPGLCIYGRHSDQPVQKILQDADLEGIALPSWSPDGQAIIFSAMPAGGNPDRDFALYQVRADGTELTRLPQLVNDLYPDWSPDGNWLAFHSGCNLAMMHPDGSDQEMLWEHDVDWCVEMVSWAPDSEAMVVSVVPGGGFHFPLERQIWFFSREDAYLIRSTVFENDECLNFDVAFSPDGQQVAYFDDCRPMMVDAAGDSQPQPMGDFPWYWLGMAYPRWEGEMPELVEFEDEVLPIDIGERVVEHCDGTAPPQICVREAETDQVFQVTHNLDFEAIYGMTWSPDGEHVVFDAGWDGDNHNLHIVNVRTSEYWNLTDNETNEINPVWSPTGEWIAFHRNCGLWLISPEGEREMMLREGSDEFCVSEVSWSPDGRNLAYLNYDGPDRFPGEIWVRNVEEEAERPIFGLEPDIDPWTVTWDPSGQDVLFLYGLNDNQTHMLLLDPRGDKEPQTLNDDDFGDMGIWTWLPDYWPQWSEAR